VSVSLQIYDYEVGIQWNFSQSTAQLSAHLAVWKILEKTLTDRAKPGSKHMILIDQKSIPLAAIIIPANHSDMNQLKIPYLLLGLHDRIQKSLSNIFAQTKGLILAITLRP
jgi:hypothetical protein